MANPRKVVALFKGASSPIFESLTPKTKSHSVVVKKARP